MIQVRKLLVSDPLIELPHSSAIIRIGMETEIEGPRPGIRNKHSQSAVHET